MENEQKTTCPTCHSEYEGKSQQAKMVKDTGECHYCDHARIEQFDEIRDEEEND